MLTACAEDGLNEVSGTKPTDEAPETLIASFEDDDTRIQLNDELRTVWTEGDLVSVFYRSDANQKWQYTGQTGARVGELTRVDAGTATTPTTRVVVVYPYNASYYFNTETYNVQASLPAVQTYLSGSYGVDGNILVSSGEYNQISLKSVCGWLKLQLTGEGEKVRSITLRGNNGEQVAGELYINTSDATAQLASAMGGSDDGDVGGAGGGLIFEDTILKEVTLNCGEGVELGAEATAFYIALPPQTFENGFTVEIEDTDGYVMEQSTDKALTIERNHIQPMTAMEFTPSVPNNQIWYTSYYGDIVEPNNTNVFGANIVSNTYTNGKGVITFEGDVTKIGDYAFHKCSSLTSVTIPDSVTTIGNGAFSGCESLKEFKGIFAADNGRCLIMDNTIIAYAEVSGTTYTIPDSVTTIGEFAFYYCKSLTSVTIPDSVTTIGDWAFSDCESLTSVTIPNSVTTIGAGAFCACKSLTSVTIPDSVTTIGAWAFIYCRGLKEFNGKFAADGGRCLIMDNTIIAYAEASGTTYTIPDSVTTIGVEAFCECSSLTSVTIPDSVTTIGGSAFAHCTSLKTVYCKPTTPPTGGTWMFNKNAAGRRIFVPASDDDSIINAYKAKEYWSDYADYIFEEE